MVFAVFLFSNNRSQERSGKGDKFMSKVPEIFGSMVFDNATMKERLPKETYKTLMKTI